MSPDQTDDQPENLPDIDAGLDELSTETTAADLLRKQGQRKKIRVINQKQLKAQIQDWIHLALSSVMSDNAHRLEDSERQALVDQAEERVQELMQRTKQMEQDRAREAEARQQAESRLRQLADEHGANDELQASIAQLQERVQKAELIAEEAQQDLLVAEQDLENTKKMFQTTLAEKDRLNDTVRQHMRHTTDLVAQVLTLDSEYYGNRHQEEHPLPEDAEAAQAFYHDFAVGTQVVNTLSQDLTRLREITSGKSGAAGEIGEAPTDAEIEVPAQGQLLERDLQLLEQLKSGSLSAVDVAAPVDNLVEALSGLREEVVAVQRQAQEGGTAAVRQIAAMPDSEGDPAEVLAGATQVVRQLSAAIANQRGALAEAGSSGEDRDKANQALRENMIRTADLVQGVLALDQDYYGGRHQEENPSDESAEGAEAFYHDFDVGAKIIETLSQDLARLRELTKDQEKYSGLLDSDLAMLEQLKTGSLSAVDVAAPVENLLAALEGAREEMVELQRSTGDDAAARTALSAVPDAEDGDPAEVLAGATQVVRQLSAALAQQRNAAAGASSEDLDKANQALRENMIRTADLVQGVLALDQDYYGGRHQEQNPTDESAEGAEAFYHDFDVGAKIIETLSQDLARLRELTKDQEKYSGLLDSDLAMLEQLKAGSLSAVDVAAPVENLVEALRGARAEATELKREASEAMGLPDASPGISELPEVVDDQDPAEVIAQTTQVARELASTLANERRRVAALKSLADEADELRSGTEAESATAQALADGLVERIASAARAAEITVPESLSDGAADGEQRLAAAAEVLESMSRQLAEERAQAQRLGENIDAVMAEEGEGDAAEAAPGQDADELATRVQRLGHAYGVLREAYKRSQARNLALADQLQALARDLYPEYAEDEEIAVDIREVSKAAEETSDRAAESGRNEALTAALDHLIDAMRRRAGELARSDDAAVDQLGDELLAAAKEDETLAGDDATIDLAMAVESESADPQVSKAERSAAVATAASKVIAALRARQAELRGEAERLREELGRAQAGQRELAAELESTAESLLANEVHGLDSAPLQSARSQLAGALGAPAVDGAEPEHPGRVADAAKGVIARLREREQELAERVLELEAKLRLADEQQGELDDLRQRLSDGEERAGALEEEIREAESERDAAQASLAETKEQLRQARAELEDYRAREQEAGGRLSTSQGKLREELEEARRERDAAEQRLADASEEMEATIAGLRARCEDLDKRIEDRDDHIHRLQADLDRDLEERVDSREGQARVQALRTELEAERKLRAELEGQLESYKGGIGDELKGALRGRDELAEQVRRLEGELSEQRGQAESLKAAKDKLRQDMAQQSERLRAEIQRERELREQVEEADGGLRDEIAGLKARLRALTEGEEGAN